MKSIFLLKCYALGTVILFLNKAGNFGTLYYFYTLIHKYGKQNISSVVLFDLSANHYIKEKVGSYEALFNKRAMKYRSMGLNKETLTEAQWKAHILSEYTFIKRPLAVINDHVFAGNAKKTVEALKAEVNG